MLKFLPLGAALATVFSTQVSENSLASYVNNATRQEHNSSLALVVTDKQGAIAPNVTLASSRAEFDYNQPQETEESNEVGALVVLAAIAGTAAVAIASSRKQQPLQVGASSNETNIFNQANPKLQKRLLTLLHNDRATANRILAHIRLNHPNQSINWAMEKAIYDLERDRGGR